MNVLKSQRKSHFQVKYSRSNTTNLYGKILRYWKDLEIECLLKENDDDVDGISFTTEAIVVNNMKEGSLISEQKKYPLVSKPTNVGASVENSENAISLADISTINMNERAVFLVINVNTRAQEKH